MRLKDEDKITRIYLAAIKVVNREGFQGSSMSKIAKEADVSPATIYLYFENKDDMITKLYLHLKVKMGYSYFTKDLVLTPTKATFRALWANHYQYIKENIDEYNFLENFSNSPLIDQIESKNKSDYCSTIETLFEHSKASNLILNTDNDIIYSLLFAPISHLVKKTGQNKNSISTNNLIQIFESSWKAISAE